MSAEAASALGATVTAQGVDFAVWAPDAQQVDLLIEGLANPMTMQPDANGVWRAHLAGARAHCLYWFRLDGHEPFPDPCSRYQPRGVSGPSCVVDPHDFTWSDATFAAPPLRALTLYELHVGTFTPAGTFAGVREKLPYLRDLGIGAIELLPVHDFAGRWNWGYDCGALFAPSRAYGTPNELRALVDAAHAEGIAVFLDVVYNHFGPAGAYAPAFSGRFFSRSHHTAWGPAINLDGQGSAQVRQFFIQNACAWLTEYHLDGLRLDATGALVDDSPKHFLEELSETVAALPGPRRALIAEDPRNLARLVWPRQQGGYGLDGIWIDDFHHQVHVTVTDESEGYYQDYAPGCVKLAALLQKNWLFCGEYSAFQRRPRGTKPLGTSPEHAVICLQNHDQIGNRALGDRLTEKVEPSVWRAASALLLFVPQTPLLFMGQEWAASTPFQFFTDHDAELGKLVSRGRLAEFKDFGAFAQNVPDPQDPQTFRRSKLIWSEQHHPNHMGIWRLYQELLRRRRTLLGRLEVLHADAATLLLRRGDTLLSVTLAPGQTVCIPPEARLVWHSEDPNYGPHTQAPSYDAPTLRCPHATACLWVL